MIFLNGVKISPEKFSDNSSQVWKLDFPRGMINAHVKWVFGYDGEVVEIAQLKTLLDSLYPPVRSVLVVDYLPYGRQDGIVFNDSAFGLITFGKILNSLGFDEVWCTDPHNEAMAIKSIMNLKMFYPDKMVRSIFEELKSDIICYPSVASLSKYSNKYYLSCMFGTRRTDQKSGEVGEYDLRGSPKNKSVLIVTDVIDDYIDLCDLTKKLLSSGAIEVNLFGTHGIFSKGYKPFVDAGIKNIFTKDGKVLYGQTSF